MKEEIVVLVDEKDQQIGQMDKIEVHQKGLLHRAISVFVIDIYGNWLLQQRSMQKHHSQGLWTNTCCTHPFPDETPLQAAHRRLKEEIGIDCQVEELFTFIYNENVENGMIENEFDHIFLGICNQTPEINTNEVMDFKYIDFDTLDADVKVNPTKFTVWFKKLYEIVEPYIKDKTNTQ